MDRTTRLGAALLASATAVTLTGCGALTERAMESAVERIEGVDGVDLDVDSGSFSFETEDGTVTMDADADDGQVTIETPEGTMRSGASTEVPAAVTDVLRLPSGFEAVTVTELSDAESTSTSVGGVVPGGSMTDLLAELTTALEDAGLTIALRSESAEFSNLVTEELDGPGRQVTVLVIADGEDALNLQLTLIERR